MPVSTRDHRRAASSRTGSATSRSLTSATTRRCSRAQFNDGKMDGFVQANSDNGRDGAIAMGHYDDRDLPYYWNIADNYVLFDRFFTSAKAGSVRNHMYCGDRRPGVNGQDRADPARRAGATCRRSSTGSRRPASAGSSTSRTTTRTSPSDRATGSSVDRAAQVIWVPLLAYARYRRRPGAQRAHRRPGRVLQGRCSTAPCPRSSYLVPSGDSEHPPGQHPAGQRLVRALVNELMREPLWDPPPSCGPTTTGAAGTTTSRRRQVDKWGYGFRVPALLVSP